MLKAIIFDMDGIIVNTEHLHAKSHIDALAKHGIKLDEKTYYDFWTRKGKGTKEFVEENKFEVSVDKIREEKRALYIELVRKELQVCDGAVDKVRELSGRYKLALVTSSHRKETNPILEQTGSAGFLDAIVTGDDVEKRKPEPDGFIMASNKLGIKPVDIIVIEDAEKGLIAAKRAGMKCIIIPNACTIDNDFSSADLIIKSMRELTPGLLEKL